MLFPVSVQEPLSYTHAVLLGIVQGLTEFLPVSSSGHLALAHNLGLEPDASLAFDVLLHVGSVLVVVRAYWADLGRILHRERLVLWYLVLGTVPAIVFGYLFRDLFDGLRTSPLAVCGALLVTAGALVWCHRTPEGHRTSLRLGPVRTLLIGLAQAVALVPGISRSGLTLTAGTLVGLGRREAVRFSFLLMIPGVMGAAGYELVHSRAQWSVLISGPAVVGFLATVLSAHFALRLFLAAVLAHRLRVFAAYCALLAAAGFLYFGLIAQ